MKKLNNKILLIIVLALGLVYVGSKYFKGNTKTNLPSALVIVDSAKVTEIKVRAQAANFEEISLVRDESGWRVKAGEVTATTEEGIVTSLFRLFPAKPLELVTTREEQWSAYQVGDTTTHVAFMGGDKMLAELRIGRIGFAQQPAGSQQMGAGGVMTYVRVGDDPGVYAVEGYLGASFNKPFNDWRDKVFLRLPTADITKINFNYPADSGFVLQQADSRWLVNNQLADSARAANFLSQLSVKRATTIVDDFSAPPQPQVTIEIYNGLTLLSEIKAWKREEDWVLRSSYRQDADFSSKGLEGLLKSAAELLPL